MDWIAANSCNAAMAFGWLVGGGTGLFADIVLLLALIYRRGAFARRHLLWLLAAAWLGGGACVGLDAASCYATGVAVVAAIIIGLPLFLLINTAAHQIARRSVK